MSWNLTFFLIKNSHVSPSFDSSHLVAKLGFNLPLSSTPTNDSAICSLANVYPDLTGSNPLISIGPIPQMFACNDNILINN